MKGNASAINSRIIKVLRSAVANAKNNLVFSTMSLASSSLIPNDIINRKKINMIMFNVMAI